jgi:hypothetical protein
MTGIFDGVWDGESLFVVNNEILDPVNISPNSSFAIPPNNHMF